MLCWISNYALDLSSFDTSNVTDMGMFSGSQATIVVEHKPMQISNSSSINKH